MAVICQFTLFLIKYDYMNKKDFLLAVVAGFFTAIFLLPIFKNTKISFAGYLIAAMVLTLPILWILAIFTGRFLSRWFSWIYQFVKFCIVGFLNASIDFGVLNLMSIYTGLTSGFIIGGVNAPGFIIAAINSYFWNKFWVFSHKIKEGEPVNYRDLPIFMIVVVSGAIINSGIVILISTYVPPFFDLSNERWLNIAKITASAVALAWSFLGFKFFAFKSKEDNKLS